MADKAKIQEWVNKDLKGFKILEMTEVYGVDFDGRKSVSVGFFKDQDFAKAFAGMKNGEGGLYRTEKAMVLTNGTIGYVINNREPVKLLNEKTEKVAITKNALSKLSPEERKILGLE